jgi:transcriptional regulator with GAF, ATPase, and Fis domain
VRQGAYSCYDRFTSASELADILTAAEDEIQSRRSVFAQNRQGWRSLLVGDSVPMQDLARIIDLVAPRRCTVLITGETGTGKEMAARAIHLSGDRSHRPMVAINCSAIPEHLLEAELFGHTKGAFTGAVSSRAGRFEEANHGTLFLDEIGDMPIDLQAKLLRVLQERELQRLGSSETIRVDVRVIAASNMDLHERVKEGKFREDLYYRLNVVPVKMPPLRERPEDIRPLARHFVAKICKLEGIEPKEIYNETLDHLMRYDWPGNVRQLENMVEKAVVLSGDRQALVPGDFVLPANTTSLPFPMPASPDLGQFSVPDQGLDFARTMTQLEKMILDQALVKAGGNKTLAADLLRLKRTTLMSKLRVLEEVAS